MRVPVNEDYSFDLGGGNLPPHWDGTVDGLRELHVMPETDSKPHDWRFCKCNPYIEGVTKREPGQDWPKYIGTIYIHNYFKPPAERVGRKNNDGNAPVRFKDRGRRSSRSAVGIEMERLKKELNERLGN